MAKYCIGLFVTFTTLNLVACGGGSNKSDDPLFVQQWHLNNTGQKGRGTNSATAGEDINILPVWAKCEGEDVGCRGENVNVVVVDSGVQIAHEDLASNVSLELSHNFNTNRNDPTPYGITERDVAHGTAVAGLLAARDNNSLGGRGVAPRATLASYNLLDKPFTDFESAEAMLKNSDQIQISNNSWGNPDCSGSYDEAPLAWKEAVKQGVFESRNGLGVAYFWASGNGGLCYDEARKELDIFDGAYQDAYASTPWVIAVNALNSQGKASRYAEQGANILISSYGGEFCDTQTLISTDLEITGNAGLNDGDIFSFDLPNSKYTKCMNGTSAATPLAAGVGALVLQANPSLSARDLRAILATTARQNDDTHERWRENDAGYMFNEIYGFGAVDAEAAVNAAKTWQKFPELQSASEAVSPALAIPDNNKDGVLSTLTVSNSNIDNVEYVELHVEVPDHTYIGDLAIVVGKGNTASVLANRNFDDSTGLDWVFSSTHFLEMSADGVWYVFIQDVGTGDTGTLTTLTLTVYGH